MVLSEVTAPAASRVLVPPTLVPPVAQSWLTLVATAAGPHRKKSTAPAGVPAGAMPPTAMLSLAIVPGMTVVLFGVDCVVMVGVWMTVVKHSPLTPMVLFVWVPLV